jgi:hypothetical protein
VSATGWAATSPARASTPPRPPRCSVLRTGAHLAWDGPKGSAFRTIPNVAAAAGDMFSGYQGCVAVDNRLPLQGNGQVSLGRYDLLRLDANAGAFAADDAVFTNTYTHPSGPSSRWTVVDFDHTQALEHSDIGKVSGSTIHFVVFSCRQGQVLALAAVTRTKPIADTQLRAVASVLLAPR